jgi:ribosomal protein S18 acetylase RimI-like enzyme
MLDLAMPPNQTHRADVQKMLVDPKTRRRGVARALMTAIEQDAIAADRSLLVLDTRQGDPSEALYREAGWQQAGVIPEFCRNADGTLSGTVLFYRNLAA